MSPVLQGLAARVPLQQRVALVVAHPDDETIAAGGSLHLMPGLVLVHVTDGAPRRLDDSGSQGFDTPAAYEAARELELQAALAVAGVAPERVRLGVPDQDAALHLRGIAGDLGAVFARYGVGAVLTHAYEGGHPDHDATALAVHAAAVRLRVPVFEFAGYHGGAVAQVTGSENFASSPSLPGLTRQSSPGWDGRTRDGPHQLATSVSWQRGSDGRVKPGHDVVSDSTMTVEPDPQAASHEMVVQRFLPGPVETLVRLDPAEAARKRAMLDCFRTQFGILRLFSPAEERFRAAPAYDFCAPPHAGLLNYESWGWEMTGVRWRRLAAEAMEGRLACAG